MKYTFLINQAGVVRCGLLGQVGLPALCVLDYVGGWFFCGKARRVTVEGREFVWLHYEHAVTELPLLFNPQAGLPSRKNQLSRLVQGLRDAGLVETIKVGRDLYLRPSDLAAALGNSRERTVSKSTPAITPGHGDTVTSSHDDTITPNGDDSPPLIIDETTTSETTISKPVPHSPPKGECEAVARESLRGVAGEIYAAYPKQVGRPDALRAILRALKAHRPEFLLERTRLFAATYSGEFRFIPYPSTWFNQERFNDAPDVWKASGQSRTFARPPAPLRQLHPTNYNQDPANL